MDEHGQPALDETPRPIAPDADPRRLYLVIGVLVGIIVLLIIRPWGEGSGAPPGAEGGVPGGGPGGTGRAAADGAAAGAPAPADPYADLWITCGSPSGWRAAAIQAWAGWATPIRSWIAIEPVTAAGPLDAAIPFAPVATDRVTAIGYCSPLAEQLRPPLSAAAALWMLSEGVATPVELVPLEPPTPNALGGLWRPPAGIGAGESWVPGRYVIEIGSPAGGYRQWLGIEVRDLEQERGSAAPSPRPSATSGGPSLPSGSPGSSQGT